MFHSYHSFWLSFCVLPGKNRYWWVGWLINFSTSVKFGHGVKKAFAWLCYCIRVIVAHGSTILRSYHVSTENSLKRVFIEKSQLLTQNGCG